MDQSSLPSWQWTQLQFHQMQWTQQQWDAEHHQELQYYQQQYGNAQWQYRQPTQVPVGTQQLHVSQQLMATNMQSNGYPIVPYQQPLHYHPQATYPTYQQTIDPRALVPSPVLFHPGVPADPTASACPPNNNYQPPPWHRLPPQQSVAPTYQAAQYRPYASQPYMPTGHAVQQFQYRKRHDDYSTPKAFILDYRSPSPSVIITPSPAPPALEGATRLAILPPPTDMVAKPTGSTTSDVPLPHTDGAPQVTASDQSPLLSELPTVLPQTFSAESINHLVNRLSVQTSNIVDQAGGSTATERQEKITQQAIKIVHGDSPWSYERWKALASSLETRVEGEGPQLSSVRMEYILGVAKCATDYKDYLAKGGEPLISNPSALTSMEGRTAPVLATTTTTTSRLIAPLPVRCQCAGATDLNGNFHHNHDGLHARLKQRADNDLDSREARKARTSAIEAWRLSIGAGGSDQEAIIARPPSPPAEPMPIKRHRSPSPDMPSVPIAPEEEVVKPVPAKEVKKQRLARSKSVSTSSRVLRSSSQYNNSASMLVTVDSGLDRSASFDSNVKVEGSTNTSLIRKVFSTIGSKALGRDSKVKSEEIRIARGANKENDGAESVPVGGGRTRGAKRGQQKGQM